MHSKRVDSSVILTAGYDQARRILKVRFRNGRSYYYLAVPPAVYRALITAPSRGKYLNEVIKPAYRVVAERDALRLRERATKRRR